MKPLYLRAPQAIIWAENVPTAHPSSFRTDYPSLLTFLPPLLPFPLPSFLQFHRSKKNSSYLSPGRAFVCFTSFSSSLYVTFLMLRSFYVSPRAALCRHCSVLRPIRRVYPWCMAVHYRLHWLSGGWCTRVLHLLEGHQSHRLWMWFGLYCVLWLVIWIILCVVVIIEGGDYYCCCFHYLIIMFYVRHTMLLHKRHKKCNPCARGRSERRYVCTIYISRLCLHYHLQPSSLLCLWNLCFFFLLW